MKANITAPELAQPDAARPARQPYVAPRLVVYGSVQALTAGGSAGKAEGGGFNRPPTEHK